MSICPSTRKREENLKRRYGITIKDYDDMLESQDHKCGLCGNEAKRYVVDHCHATGKTRSLLCYRCNVILGHFGDNIHLMEKAIEYLTKHA